MKWFKNDQPINEADSRIEVKGGENKLIITRPLDTDVGNYSCVISNKKTNTSDLRLDFNVICKFFF